MHRHIGLLLVFAALAACSLLPSGGLDGQWRLTSGTVDGQQIPISAQAPMTLTLDSGQAVGRGGCNSFGGRATISGDRVAFGQLSSTLIGCDDPLGRAEQLYLTALGRVERGHRDGAMLTLSGSGIELTFSAVAPTPDSSLTGTTWHLESVISADTVASASGSEAATLVFADDGTVTGSTSCHDFTVAFTRDATAVTLGAVSVPDGSCAGPTASIEAAVVKVLGPGVATARVDQDRLIVTGSDGRRLEYRAGS